MLKKTITYPSFDGETTITEDFYFNLTTTEAIELETSIPGGWAEYYTAKLAENEIGSAVQELKRLIGLSYGVRSENGKFFAKTEQATYEFLHSNAYDVLFTDLMMNSTMAADFLNNVFPKDLAEKMQAMGVQVPAQTSNTASVVPLPRENVEDTRPSWIKEDRDPTQAELVAMPKSELVLAMQRRLTK